ncbi:Uncharacterized protein HZ326_27551 [Fusarium oxysporum f. sp. albedinis]|nr:Uncharacterized protein HZ326_27551 [Fusarium oxysporum f. sp. albedinis]
MESRRAMPTRGDRATYYSESDNNTRVITSHDFSNLVICEASPVFQASTRSNTFCIPLYYYFSGSDPFAETCELQIAMTCTITSEAAGVLERVVSGITEAVTDQA